MENLKQYWQNADYGPTEYFTIDGFVLGSVSFKSVAKGEPTINIGVCKINNKKATAKSREVIKKWVEDECKKAIESIYQKLQ